MPPAVDYILFSAAMLAGTIALHAWLRRRGDRGLTWPIWLMVRAVRGAGAIATERVDPKTRERLQRAVIGLAPTYAMEVERMGHAAIGLQTAADDPTYLRIIDAEKRWLAANPVVNDIYTFRPIDPTHVALIVDSETDYDHNGRYEGEREARTAIGEHFDLDSPYVSAAMAGRGGLDPVPAADRWGTWVSAFWPLRDAQGRVEAVLGVDYEASAWNREIRGARYAAMGVAAIVLLTLLAGSALFALQRIELVTRQSAAEAMRQARDAAESASRLKSEFLACMSHEIRTPMNGVMGVAELLLGTELQPRQRHFADLILRSATNLLAVINDILDYSKIEADKLVLEDIEFDPHEVVEDVGELLGGRAGAKGLELVVRLPQQSPGRVSGDAGRIRQVLTNLVGNAVKFTDSGEVEVTVRWLELASQRPTLRCEVRDTGPGMDAPTRAALFSPSCRPTARSRGASAARASASRSRAAW
ncbi:MAG: histidine kinase dimerization/phospho-acceptor domain-containing protein [Steroidobacteraceae bacterium]